MLCFEVEERSDHIGLLHLQVQSDVRYTRMLFDLQMSRMLYKSFNEVIRIYRFRTIFFRDMEKYLNFLNASSAHYHTGGLKPLYF